MNLFSLALGFALVLILLVMSMQSYHHSAENQHKDALIASLQDQLNMSERVSALRHGGWIYVNQESNVDTCSGHVAQANNSGSGH